MASNNEKLLDTVGQAFRAELPEFSSMDEYLDFLIPKVRPWGEDLREEKHYVNRAWLEFQDDDQFHDIVLHFSTKKENTFDRKMAMSVRGTGGISNRPINS